MNKHLLIYSKFCGDCTKCCEGWLEGVVHGHRMYRGCNCFYLEKSCQIYEDRPENPCKNYNCAWLTDDVFPGWMKPNLSNVVISKRFAHVPTQDGMRRFDYYDAIEAGNKMDSSVLNWLLRWAIDSKINLVYEVDGHPHALGDEEFKSFLT